MFFKSDEKHIFKKPVIMEKENQKGKGKRYGNRQVTEEESICLISAFKYSQPH